MLVCVCVCVCVHVCVSSTFVWLSSYFAAQVSHAACLNSMYVLLLQYVLERKKLGWIYFEAGGFISFVFGEYTYHSPFSRKMMYRNRILHLRKSIPLVCPSYSFQ